MERNTLKEGLAVLLKSFILIHLLFHLTAAASNTLWNEIPYRGIPSQNYRKLILKSNVPGLGEIEMDGAYELPIDSPGTLSAINSLLQNSPTLSANNLQVLSSHYTPLEDSSRFLTPSSIIPQSNLINIRRSSFNPCSKDMPRSNSNGPKRVLFCNSPNSNSSVGISQPLLVNKLVHEPNKTASAWPANRDYFINALPLQEPFSLKNFTAMKEELLGNLFPLNKMESGLRNRYSRNSLNKNKRHLRLGRRMERRMQRSIPPPARRFHLMHGIYKENEEMMTKALEKAQYLAQSVPSHSKSFERAHMSDLVESNQPVYHDGVPQIKGRPAKRRIGAVECPRQTKTEQIRTEPVTNSDTLFDLQCEIKRKLAEIERLKGAISDLQVQTKLPLSYNPTDTELISLSRVKSGPDRESGPFNDSDMTYSLYPAQVIEIPAELVNQHLKSIRAQESQVAPQNQFKLSNGDDSDINYLEELLPSDLPNHIPEDSVGEAIENETYFPENDQLNLWTLDHESKPQHEFRKKRFCKFEDSFEDN